MFGDYGLIKSWVWGRFPDSIGEDKQHMVWSNVTEQQQPSRYSSMCSNLALIHKQGTKRPLLFFFPSLKENPATIAGPSPDKTAKKLTNYFWCFNISQPPRASHWCTQKAHILTSSISQADMKCSHPLRRWEYLAGLIHCSMWCWISHFYLLWSKLSWLGMRGSKMPFF